MRLYGPWRPPGDIPPQTAQNCPPRLCNGKSGLRASADGLRLIFRQARHDVNGLARWPAEDSMWPWPDACRKVIFRLSGCLHRELARELWNDLMRETENVRASVMACHIKAHALAINLCQVQVSNDEFFTIIDGL